MNANALRVPWTLIAVGLLAACAVPDRAAARPPEPSLIDVVPDADVEAWVENLASAEAPKREAAVSRLKNLPGTASATVERLAADEALAPAAKAALKPVLPVIAARARRLQSIRAAHELNLRTMLEVYDRQAKKSPRREDAVRAANTDWVYPQQFRTPDETPEARSRCSSGRLDVGCDDPSVRYLAARADRAAAHPGRPPALPRLIAAASDMAQSGYPPERKVIAAAVAFTEMAATAGPEPDTGLLEICLDHLPAAFASANRTPDDALELAWMIHRMLARDGDKVEAFERLYPIYAAARPKEDIGPLLFKGRAMIDAAWAARGNGLGHTVTDRGWQQFHDRLGAAGEALTRAWELDPTDARAATEMIVVAMGLEGDRREAVDLWYRRAMTADPDNFEACHRMLYYLYPRWHGSHEEMIAFGRECMAGGNWRGRIPHMLADAHAQVAREVDDEAAYLAQPHVWADVRACIEGMMAAFPEMTFYPSSLAMWACDAGQWRDAAALFKKIGDNPDLAAFGSKAMYDYYRRKAERRAASSGPAAAPVKADEQ